MAPNRIAASHTTRRRPVPSRTRRGPPPTGRPEIPRGKGNLIAVSTVERVDTDDGRSMKNHPIRAVGGVLLALVLSGCWPQQGGGPANTRANHLETELTREDAGSLSEHWRTPIDSIITEPIVAGGQLFTTNRTYGDGGSLLDVLGVQAYDPETGGLVWERSLLPTEGDPVGGGIETPAFVDGALWVPYSHDGLAGCGGELVRLDPATGAVLSADPTGRYPSAVVAADSIVAYTEVHCGGGVRLVVRDQQTRAIRWSHTFTVGGSGATPTIAGGRGFLP